MEASGPTSDVPMDRRHDLDAVRGFAMLLGIAWHAAVPFQPYYDANDWGANSVDALIDFSHGFRMPLFFLLSGYFTAMLGRRRGLRPLVEHRLRRVLVPFVLSVAVIVPSMSVAFSAGRVLGSDVSADASSAEGVEAQTSPAPADPIEVDEPILALFHLWFLWYLLLYLVAFAAVFAFAARSSIVERLGNRLVIGALVALPIVTLVPALMMQDGDFGADSSTDIVPELHVLAYYGCFFAFGAIAFGRSPSGPSFIDRVSRYWPAQLGAATFVAFPLGLMWLTDAYERSVMAQVPFAWLMCFGCIGLFRAVMSSQRFWVRYLSDASYWMYLTHLPIVVFLQGVITPWNLPQPVGFVVVLVPTLAAILVSYHVLVRYRWPGTLLNGPRTRDGDASMRTAVAASTLR